MTSAIANQPMSLTDVREQLTQAESKRDGCQKRLNNLHAQQEGVQKTIDSLERQRTELVGAIAIGVGKDADLVKLRKSLSAARDELADTADLLKATERALSQAAQEVEAARATLRAAEKKAWRAVQAVLIERHKAAVQEIANELFVTGLQCQPGLGELHFWSVLNALELKKPNPEEVQQIKTELKEEFHLAQV